MIRGMNFFKNLFSNKHTTPAYPPVTDYSGINTDIHSHLIPGIDDGVKTDEECAEMLRGFASLGFKKVITTPHIMGDHYRNTPEIISDGLEKIRGIAAKENISIAIEAAAEYYIDGLFA